MEKEVERNSKKRINEAIKEFLVWIIGVATLAIMSEQLSEIFFSTWLGSFIEGVTPNILFILFGLSIYWCTQMLRGEHGAWRKPFFILAVALGVLYVFSDVHFVEAAVLLSPVNIGIGQGHITLVFFIPLILLVLTGSLYNALVLFGFLQSPYLMLFIGSLLFISAPYIVFLISKLISLSQKKTNPKTSNKTRLFKYDHFDPKNDKPHVGRTQMIEAIVEQVKLLQHSKSSFTIGIEGGWGSGKTTLLEGIKERLRDKTDEHGNHIEVVEFSPWAYPDGKNLSVEFLYELKSVLTRYSLRARFVVNAYINALAENTNFIQAIARLLFPHESLQKVKEKLSGLILLHRVKLIVVIDDLDRLDEDEIAEVFRLLRNTGDLPNMVYLVAYDRLHVESIGQHNNAEASNSRFGSGYLDKVINVELDINSYNRDLLLGEFFSKANEIIKKEYIPLDIDIFQGFDSLSYKYQNLLRVINTKRDMLRILNSLSYRLKLIKSNIGTLNILTFIHPQLILFMELVKNSDPNIYKLIMTKGIFDDNLDIKTDVGNDSLVAAFRQIVKEHTILYPDNPDLKINPIIVIDYLFIQNQSEAILLHKMREDIFLSKDGFEPFCLDKAIEKCENIVQAKLLVKHHLIAFLQKWDWEIHQANALILMVTDVIDDDHIFYALLPSIKKFAHNISRDERILNERKSIISNMMKLLNDKRIDGEHNYRFNNYDRCYCEIYKTLDNNERNDTMLRNQIARIRWLLDKYKFLDALLQQPFFTLGQHPKEELLKEFERYFRQPESIKQAFQYNLLLAIDNSVMIGRRSFPIKSLYPDKEDFAKLLMDVSPDFDNGSLHYLGEYIWNKRNRIKKVDYSFIMDRDKDFEELLKRVPSVNKLFQSLRQYISL